MAGQDFARVKAPRKREEKESAGGSLGTIAGILFAAVACFAAGFWLGGAQQSLPETVDSKAAAVQAELDKKLAELKLQQVKIEELEESLAQWKKRVEQKASDKLGELQFYKNLPKQSVTPAPMAEAPPAPVAAKPAEKPLAPKAVDATAATAAPASVASAAGGVYRLQIVSYQSKEDAAAFQRKLFNSGFSASVQAADLPGRGTWYRVYAGPYADETSALTAQRDIQEKFKIRGLLIRDR